MDSRLQQAAGAYAGIPNSVYTTNERNLDKGSSMPEETWAPMYLTKNAILEKRLYLIFKDKFELFCKKQNDYGPGNIAKFGEHGVLVRVSDKVERLINLMNNGTIPNNESIADTWDDILLYAAIAILVREGHWPTS